MADDDAAKRAAAEAAATLVEDGMRVGLGTGSTAAFFVEALGARARAENVRLVCVATSNATAALAERVGLSVTDLSEAPELDLTVDGADEIAPDLSLIKGAGGALLREKMVAAASARLVIIADDGKLVARLGARVLPVEVVQFGWRATIRRIEETFSAGGAAIAGGGAPAIVIRGGADAPFVTDEGHYILDVACGAIADPAALDLALTEIPGVVETGLFPHQADAAIVASAEGRTRLLSRETGL